MEQQSPEPRAPRQAFGERVMVRAYEPGDGVSLFEAIDESRRHIEPWLPWGPRHQTPADTEALIAKWIEGFDAGLDFPYGIWSPDGSRLLGSSGLHRIDWSIPKMEIGYWVRASEEGHGYVTDAVRVLAEIAFEHLGAMRLFIRCAEGNVRSAAIPRRLGFVYEGVLRNDVKLVGGEVRNALVFSMLPEEWRALRS